MEPEVHIIEKYFQKILHCFTMTNIRLKGGKEIDLLAINPKTGEKFHVESRVATSPGFKLRLHDTYTKKGRAHRRGLDFFVKQNIREIFGDDKYNRILVVWAVQDENVIEQAKKLFDIEVRLIIEMIYDLMEKGKTRGSRDDILRTVELMGTFVRDTKKLLGKVVASGVREALALEK